ncbi:MAG: ABC transporter substrate-binding protein [Chitinophagaceae bacterium]|nr:MAG: ABC transporter substrate-binding protein [Chitinophagaceae bacterium]
MQKTRFVVIFLMLFSAVPAVQAQQAAATPLKTYRVGIFAPLYLDSAFSNYSYRYGKNFPKFTVPGLEKNIPFISATYPNDGGITENPFLIILNSTLKAHCEAIYSHLLQNNGADKIYLITRPGSQEKNIADNFKAINEPDGKPLVKIETITVNGDFEIIRAKLDSNKNSVFIGGSLNESFATELAAFSQSINKTYRVKLIGMPNWDGFRSISSNKKLKDFPVYYTTPYFNNKWDAFSKKIKEVYLKKYRGVPSDMTYKGFETVFLFSKMLSRNPADFMNHLNEQPYKVFSDYNFKPVFTNKHSEVPDYFENKHLYLIKILNGNFTRAN